MALPGQEVVTRSNEPSSPRGPADPPAHPASGLHQFQQGPHRGPPADHPIPHGQMERTVAHVIRQVAQQSVGFRRV
jgi:hypothetical protein